jgi:phosphate uptake regulator
MATQVLESDDVVDQYRDRIFDGLMQSMTHQVTRVSPGLQFVLATRHLERIADHATNIAEDIIFWVRGLDVRHGHGRNIAAVLGEVEESTNHSSVTKDLHGLHPGVTANCDTPPASLH